MSKQRARKRLPSDSPEDSLGDEILEIVEDSIKSKLNSRAGNAAARPKPKVMAHDSPSSISYRGAPLSRVKNPLAEVEKRTTRSVTESSKKRDVPTVELNARSKKKKRVHVSEDGDNFVSSLNSPKISDSGVRSPAPFTPRSQVNFDEEPIPFALSQRGKFKSTGSALRGAMIQVNDEEDNNNISDDWDDDEMQLAFNNSKPSGINENHAEGSKRPGNNIIKEDDRFPNLSIKNAMPIPPKVERKVYLEDFEDFVVKTLPQKDESFFPDVQDKLLSRQYRNLPPLRIGFLLSWSTSTEDIPHIPFSGWPEIIPMMEIGKESSLMNMVTMVKSGRHFNPCRASPMDLTVRESFRGRREAFVGKRSAVAIVTGYCTDSHLIRGRTNKSISILFHGQEWERYCCFVSMIFDAKEMFGQIYKSALSFSTLPESVSPPPVISNANVSPLSGRRAKINQTPVERSRGALFYSDIVPVFDAREVSMDSSVDFDDLSKTFPTFEKEVPIGSCVAVGHSISTYPGKKGDHGNENNTNLATNVLFVIIFGVPDF